MTHPTPCARRALTYAALLATSTIVSGAYADQSTDSAGASATPSFSQDRAQTDTNGAETRHDVRAEIPLVAYAYSAAGAPAKTFGASVFGSGISASGQPSLIGGGLTLWGSPIDRLTIIGDGSRNVFGNFTPSLGAIVRLIGEPGAPLVLGALGRYKIDGFGRGPQKDEIEGEIELGFLLALHGRKFHADINTIFGAGTGDDGEIDAEARVRLGRDIGRYVRVGLDGQTRVRLAGPLILANGRSWDWTLGPQLFVGHDHFFGTFTAGPTTIGTTTKNVGMVAILSIGGTTF